MSLSSCIIRMSYAPACSSMKPCRGTCADVALTSPMLFTGLKPLRDDIPPLRPLFRSTCPLTKCTFGYPWNTYTRTTLTRTYTVTPLLKTMFSLSLE